MTKKQTDPIAFYIGVRKESIIEAKKAIVEIAKLSGVSDAVKLEAFKAFNYVTKVENITVSGCTITQGSK